MTGFRQHDFWQQRWVKIAGARLNNHCSDHLFLVSSAAARQDKDGRYGRKPDGL
jgi:hypothetical protein